MSANIRRFGTLYQFHLHRQVDEVWQRMGCVVYLYLTGFWQAGGGANGRRVTGCGRVGAEQVVEGGRYISASVGGIIVVYWVDVSFTWVCVAVVSTSADPGNHCYTNSRKGDIHRVHYTDPTHTRTYIPAPFHNLLCTYPLTSGHSPSMGSSTSLQEPCQV